MLADCVFALFDIRPPAEVARLAADSEIVAQSAAAEGCVYPTALVVDELLSHDFALFLGVGRIMMTSTRTVFRFKLLFSVYCNGRFAIVSTLPISNVN